MDGFVFEHPVGVKDSRAVSARRAKLLASVPQIATSYERLRKSARLKALEIPPATLKETLAFYNAVVADGRYTKLLQKAPEKAAERLNVRLSATAAEHLRAVAEVAVGPGPVEGPVEAVIAVVVVIACARPTEGVILDSSAIVQAKL
jgi:hypothetical protein